MFLMKAHLPRLSDTHRQFITCVVFVIVKFTYCMLRFKQTVKVLQLDFWIPQKHQPNSRSKISCCASIRFSLLKWTHSRIWRANNNKKNWPHCRLESFLFTCLSVRLFVVWFTITATKVFQIHTWRGRKWFDVSSGELSERKFSTCPFGNHCCRSLTATNRRCSPLKSFKCSCKLNLAASAHLVEMMWQLCHLEWSSRKRRLA